MNEVIKKKWIKALRSGKYKQGIEGLKIDFEPNGVRYCCLGVLCEVTGNAQNRDMTGLGYPSKGNDFCGLPWAKQQQLAALNDDGKTFEEIAKVIEETV